MLVSVPAKDLVHTRRTRKHESSLNHLEAVCIVSRSHLGACVQREQRARLSLEWHGVIFSYCCWSWSLRRTKEASWRRSLLTQSCGLCPASDEVITHRGSGRQGNTCSCLPANIFTNVRVYDCISVRVCACVYGCVCVCLIFSLLSCISKKNYLMFPFRLDIP